MGDVMEFKAATASVSEQAADPMEFTIIGSVTGIVDEVGDIVVPGAYAETLTKRRPKVIKDHDWTRRLGKPLDVKELLPGDPGLPAEIQPGTPWPREAGALVAKVRLFDTREGREAAARWSEDEAQQFSIGYVPRVSTKGTGKVKRNLKTVDLFEISDVLWGAMPAAGLMPPGLATKMLAVSDEEAEAEDDEAIANAADEAIAALDAAVAAVPADDSAGETTDDDASESDSEASTEVDDVKEPAEDLNTDPDSSSEDTEPEVSGTEEITESGTTDADPDDTLDDAHLDAIAAALDSEVDLISDDEFAALTAEVNGWDDADEETIDGDDPDEDAKDGEPDGLEAKRKFTASQRADAADHQQAMPDGSYPIKTETDLRNAIQAYGRAKNQSKVKTFIVARAKALGLTDLLPDGWHQEGKAAGYGYQPGDKVMVDGQPATIVSETGGQCVVEFADGTKKTVTSDQITPVEAKAFGRTRKVKTPEGAKFFGAPIGTPITPGMADHGVHLSTEPTRAGRTDFTRMAPHEVEAANQAFSRRREERLSRAGSRETGEPAHRPGNVSAEDLLAEATRLNDAGAKSKGTEAVDNYRNAAAMYRQAAAAFQAIGKHDVAQHWLAYATDAEARSVAIHREVHRGGRKDLDEVFEAKYDTSPTGTPGGRQNWVDKAGGFPPFLRAVIHALKRQDDSEETAIQKALGAMRRWAAGGKGVTPKTRAKAVEVLAWWEAHTHGSAAGAGKSRVADLDLPWMAGSVEERGALLRKALETAMPGARLDATYAGDTAADNYVVVSDGADTFRLPYDADADSVSLGDPEPVEVVMVDADGTEVPVDADASVFAASGLEVATKALTVAMEGKAGRVLSGRNEARLRSAVENLVAVLNAAGITLNDSNSEEPADDSRQPDTATTARPGAEVKQDLVLPAFAIAEAARLQAFAEE